MVHEERIICSLVFFHYQYVYYSDINPGILLSNAFKIYLAEVNKDADLCDEWHKETWFVFICDPTHPLNSDIASHSFLQLGIDPEIKQVLRASKIGLRNRRNMYYKAQMVWQTGYTSGEHLSNVTTTCVIHANSDCLLLKETKTYVHKSFHYTYLRSRCICNAGGDVT